MYCFDMVRADAVALKKLRERRFKIATLLNPSLLAIIFENIIIFTATIVMRDLDISYRITFKHITSIFNSEISSCE